MVILPAFRGPGSLVPGSALVGQLPSNVAGTPPQNLGPYGRGTVNRFPFVPMGAPLTRSERGARTEHLAPPGTEVFPLLMGSPSERHEGGHRVHGRGDREDREEDSRPRLANPFVLNAFIRNFQFVPVPLPGRLPGNVAGTLPSGTLALDRFRSAFLADSFGVLRATFGEPASRFAFVPRTDLRHRFDFRGDGKHDGFDGHEFFHRHRHHEVVDGGFFFPLYFSDPFWFGFDYPGYFPSIYTYWGWGPGWINQIAATSDLGPIESWGAGYSAAYDPNNYTLDVEGLNRALTDLRAAWLTTNMDLFAAHLAEGGNIAVSFDGQYAYSTSAENYYAMTLDALSTTRTARMSFDSPIWLAPDRVFITGQQVFDDPEGNAHIVYISYELLQSGGNWFVTGVGSSQQPIASPYQDFRG